MPSACTRHNVGLWHRLQLEGVIGSVTAQRAEVARDTGKHHSARMEQRKKRELQLGLTQQDFFWKTEAVLQVR